MALAALIFAAQAAAGDDDGLCATLPLAGGALVEHQARLAAAAGAESIVILVERLPAALTGAVDRLRRDGLRVEIARGPADAVDRIHPEERLLVIADGCIAGMDLVTRFAGEAVPAVLTVPDDGDHAGHERIDATARWGGLLAIDGARLRRTAAMLGEWDLQSTLLRRTVQEAGCRVEAYACGDTLVAIVARREQLEELDRAIVAAPRGPAADWPARYVYPAIVDRALPPLLRRAVAARWLAAASLTLAALAVPFMLYGWRWTALALLLLSGPLAATADRLDEVRHGRVTPRPILPHGRIAAAGLVLTLLGADLAAAQGWGVWLMAAILAGGMIAFVRERTILRALAEGEPPVWVASLDGLILAAVPFAIGGLWLAAVALAAAYAVASFAYVQHRIAAIVRAPAV